jgi:hypothetical protein
LAIDIIVGVNPLCATARITHRPSPPPLSSANVSHSPKQSRHALL